MKTTIFLSATIVALVLPASAQVANDPQAPKNQTALEAGRAKAGKLATRDQNGTFQVKDGIVKAQGAVQFIKDGKMTKVNKELKLSEGYVVRQDGHITRPDGTTLTLQEGQMLTLDGKLVQAPPTTGTTEPRGTDKLPARTGNLTDYGQSGTTGPQNKPREETRPEVK
ncbi:MAG: hypothetical protein EOP84_29610 [Verrucomicrobiaceae bacterium]|nr:MAG: hypothetical protein EOP84_29610 [Verrucomicrobiaceae bacterium]